LKNHTVNKSFMILKRLVLHNFRNIESTEIKPGPGFNILTGDNGQGKTNILESIYILGHFKSFRRNRNEDLIGVTDIYSRVSGEFYLGGIRETVTLKILKDQKEILINDKRPLQSSDMFGRFPSVLFSPEEVALPRGYPAARRALIDRALCQTRPSFIDLTRAYQRCLRQRNILLKEGAPVRSVYPWTEELVNTGAMVRLARCQYLDRLLPLFKSAYREICGDRELADIIYPGYSTTLSVLQENLRSTLERETSRELKYGTTMAGPHRDDPVFMLDNRVLGIYGSQGQQRSFVLAFKTAQILDLEKETGFCPLLLLDDMTSELDRKRQEFFFRFLQQRQGQVFISCTEHSAFQSAGFKCLRMFRVKAGTICDRD